MEPTAADTFGTLPFTGETVEEPDPPGELYKKNETCRRLFTRCLNTPLLSELEWLENRLGDFNLWVASLRAASIGKTSLDYRVRENHEVRRIICDLLLGLSEALEILSQAAERNISSTTTKAENEAQYEIEGEDDNNLSCEFSYLSTNDSDTESLPSIAKVDGSFSEQMYNIRTILGQLARISTAIRRSGANFRHERVDKSLKEDHYEDFRAHMTFIILMNDFEVSAVKLTDSHALQTRVMDSKRLSEVQKRLIHANIVRRNRMVYAMESTKRNETSAAQQTQQPEMHATISFAESGLQPSQERTKSTLKSIQARSKTSPSTNHTATDIDSRAIQQHVLEPQKSTPSVITRVAQTVDYPRCPKPTSQHPGYLQCPYCSDMLPVSSYLKNQTNWRGHLAQDILPYMCIYKDCQTPAHMYPTSNELFKHMRNQHGVVGWVCDYCAAKKEADQQTFVFNTLEDWTEHMRKTHAAAIKPSQISSLAKISQRKVLEPLGCPLCGYADEHPQSTLDDHIAKHLHEFSLRCLPWGTGENEDDSINAKSDDSSTSANEEEERENLLQLTEESRPTLLVDELQNIIIILKVDHDQKAHLSHVYSDDLLSRISMLHEQVAQYMHQYRLDAVATLQTYQLGQQRAYPSVFKANRKSGKLPSFKDAPPLALNPQRKLETLRTHLSKILCILWQSLTGWKALNARDLYRAVHPRPDSFDLESDWLNLPDNERTRFQDKSDEDMVRINSFNKESIETLLLDELNSMEETLNAIQDMEWDSDQEPWTATVEENIQKSDSSTGRLPEPIKTMEEEIQRLAKGFPPVHHENRNLWRPQLPHAIQLLQESHDFNEKSELCLLVGRCLSIEGQIQEALRWLEESYRLRSELDEEDPKRLLLQHILAMAYQADGQVTRALRLLEHVVAVREKQLPTAHPDLLAAKHELAGAYKADGQTERALMLLQYVVAIRNNTLAKHHPDRLASQHELARAYRANGQVRKAIQLLESVVREREKMLAKEHPDRLASQQQLARAYQANGEVGKAVELLENIVEVEAKVLVQTHPNGLDSQHSLAQAYQAQGRVDEAVALLQSVAAVDAQIFREDHPSRVATQQLLSDLIGVSQT